MHPILFQFKSLTIYTYGFFVALAMVVSFFLADRRARQMKLPQSMAADLLFLLFVSGVLGARLFYVLQHFSEYRGNLWLALSIQEGGLVWYGGFITASIAGFVYAGMRHWPVLRLYDFFAPLLPLAHGIGRIGCFFNGCCYGQSEVAVPIQLVEAGFLFALSFWLYALGPTRRRDGELFIFYLLFYSVLRFILEFFRGDQSPVFFLTLPQWVSLLLFTAACLFLGVLKKRA